MPIANWRTQCYNVVQSLFFNNPHRVIEYSVRDSQGKWHNRADNPAPVRRLYETEATPERTCLQTVQFVHQSLIPPGGRHVAELHIHPDAEELVIVMRGQGTVLLGDKTFPIAAEDIVHVPPGVEHEFRNTGDEMLAVVFINVPTGEGVKKLQAAQAAAEKKGRP